VSVMVWLWKYPGRFDLGDVDCFLGLRLGWVRFDCLLFSVCMVGT
jgi:hypothetical protein